MYVCIYMYTGLDVRNNLSAVLLGMWWESNSEPLISFITNRKENNIKRSS